MNRAKRQRTPKHPQRQPIEAEASPELRSLIKTDSFIMALEPVALVFNRLYDDATRLANATPPDTADKPLLDLVSECDAALAVHKALWSQSQAERQEAERIAEARGYARPDRSPEAWHARYTFAKQYEPTRSFDRANEAHKEFGRAARAVFAVKAKTLRGAVAKLCVLVKIIDADELETWQGDKDWLAEALADFERIAR